MKAVNFKILLISILISLAFIKIHAQQPAAQKIAILPFSSSGIDSVSVQTAESILNLELSKQEGVNVIQLKRSDDDINFVDCMDSKCAVEIGRKAGADKALGCKLAALGNKIVVQYFLVDVKAEKEILLDQLTSATVEDLETVMKRIAKSAYDLIPASEDASVGNILKGESVNPLRRASKKNVGLSFGYLYPQNGYDGEVRSFVVDLNLDYELQEYAVGMMFGIRQGFAMNVYGEYLFSDKDICPYLGGAFGFHWVSHDNPSTVMITDQTGNTTYSSNPNNLRSDGFEFSAITGVKLLHTYNFQVMLNLEFIYSLNDYHDSAIVFTIGIL